MFVPDYFVAVFDCIVCIPAILAGALPEGEPPPPSNSLFLKLGGSKFLLNYFRIRSVF